MAEKIPIDLLDDMKGQLVTTTWAFGGMRWKLIGYVDRFKKDGFVLNYQPGRLAKIITLTSHKISYTEVDTLLAIHPLPKKKPAPKPDPLEEAEKKVSKKEELVLDGKMTRNVNDEPLPEEFKNLPMTTLNEVREEIAQMRTKRNWKIPPKDLTEGVSCCKHNFPINRGCPDCKEDIPEELKRQGYIKDRWGNVRHPVMIRMHDRWLKEQLAYLSFDELREMMEFYKFGNDGGQRAMKMDEKLKGYWRQIKP